MTRRFGVVARGDHSGLAAQTRAVAHRLGATAILGIDLGDRGRGPSRWDTFPPDADIRVSDDWPDDDDVRWIVDRCDVIYTAEVTGHDGLGSHCAMRGVRLVVHANPELWLPKYGHGLPVVWAPTRWRLDLLPDATTIVPMPVETPRTRPSPRTRVRRLLHVSSDAMLDRNGTAQVLDALPDVTVDVDLVVAGHSASVATFPTETNPRVNVTRLGPVENRWSLYDNVDALLIPRRYGGLCLPMLEAASRGLPIVHLDSDPLGEGVAVPARAEMVFEASGGRIVAFGAEPGALATAIDRLVSEPPLAHRESVKALGWAQALSWDHREADWRSRLGLTAG